MNVKICKKCCGTGRRFFWWGFVKNVVERGNLRFHLGQSFSLQGSLFRSREIE